jgi:hypothetical protein
MRAFLHVLAEQAGHQIDVTRIEPRAWNEASREADYTQNYRPMRAIIAREPDDWPVLPNPAQLKRALQTKRMLKGRTIYWGAVVALPQLNSTDKMTALLKKQEEIAALSSQGV